CQTLRFGPLPSSLLERHLVTERGLDPGEARLRAALASGSLAAALAFESEAYRSLRAELLGLLERIERLSARDRLLAAERLEQTEDAPLVLTTLRSLLRDVAAARAGMPASRLINADAGDRLVALSREPLGARAAALAAAAGETRKGLRGYANKLLSFD